MNADTLLKVQVAALVAIAIELAILIALLAVFGVELLEYIPEVLETIDALEQALRETSR